MHMHEGKRTGSRRRGPMNRRARLQRRQRMLERQDVATIDVTPPNGPTEEELAFLEDYAREVIEDLKALRSRIDELRSGQESCD